MMYCPSCGKEVVAGLTFCNFCGSKLKNTETETKTTTVTFIALIFGIVSVFAIGLGFIIGLLVVMKNIGYTDEMIGIIVTFCFLTMLIVEAMFMWLLIKRNRSNKESNDISHLKEQSVKELYSAPKRALGESTIDPVPSVTEHTTRTLEHAPKVNS